MMVTGSLKLVILYTAVTCCPDTSVTVVVPADAVVSVDASASAGEVTVFGRQDDGVDAQVSENSIPPGSMQSGTVKTIQIDAHVGLGNVSVSRIPR